MTQGNDAWAASGQMLQTLDQILQWRGVQGSFGHFDQEVEVVGENAPGEDPHTALGSALSQVRSEQFPLAFLEYKVAIHDPGDAVIETSGFFRTRLGTRVSHSTPTNSSLEPYATPI